MKFCIMSEIYDDHIRTHIHIQLTNNNQHIDIDDINDDDDNNIGIIQLLNHRKVNIDGMAKDEIENIKYSLSILG